MHPTFHDKLDRPLRSLRISVTDRCNLRCTYCMPEEAYRWLPRADLLDFDEIKRVAEIFARLGVNKIRLTGGEPLLRRDLPVLVSYLAAIDGIEDLALTCNGLLLAEQAEALKRAGLSRLTVSLDTLRPERFKAITRRAALPQVLEGLEAAQRAGFTRIKLDTVVLRGTNDDEMIDLLDFARAHDMELRFIEYMDVGGATRWSRQQLTSKKDMLARINAHYSAGKRGTGEAVKAQAVTDPAATARRFSLPDGTSDAMVFGIIASTTEPFCKACDRSRLTADGRWFLCLYAKKGVDLREPLRRGAGPDELLELIQSTWQEREDRGAEKRFALAERGPLFQAEELRGDPHLEMHTRGG